MVIGAGKKVSALHLPVVKEGVLSEEHGCVLRENEWWIEPRQEILSIDTGFAAAGREMFPTTTLICIQRDSSHKVHVHDRIQTRHLSSGPP
jgi:hypothetical protein